MQELLAAFPQIDAVMCATDEIALGVADALKESGRTGVKVYGVNGSPEAKAAIAGGDSPLQGTGALSPIEIGQTAMDVCFAILEEKEYESETEVETFLINSENVELYGTNGWQ